MMRLRAWAGSMAKWAIPVICSYGPVPPNGQSDQLQPATEEFRRAAFVGRDVRLGMTQHRPPRRAQMRDRERIRGRAGWHQENRHLALENFPKPRLDLFGPIVVAVTERVAGIGAADCL